jgi:hypothetical protein
MTFFVGFSKELSCGPCHDLDRFVTDRFVTDRFVTDGFVTDRP